MMIFENLAIERSEGKVLAHSVITPSFKLSKGKSISAETVAQLSNSGLRHIHAVTLEDDDIDESQAALKIAKSLAGKGLYLERKPSGSVDIKAREAGLIQLDSDAINKCNRLSESVTIATRYPDTRVESDDRVATVKVIPYAAKRRVVDAITRYLSPRDDVVGVHSFRSLNIGLIQTRSSHQRDPLWDKTQSVIEDRLKPVGASLSSVIRCEHHQANIQESILDQKLQGCDIIVVVAPSATVDRNDVIPASIIAPVDELSTTECQSNPVICYY